ncbi:GNAT family N-acetyltransferase [Agrobacterium genomosp. 3]|uniref:GNAT family N-acetyltransferase n=4 Tax=Hyphomicrobiales TaxID=356 RepID=A0AA50CKI6_9HYPH|nr:MULTISPECIES: GNAT family N-acetyltransferase [Hyphomicrobiales]KRA03914.1 molybdopterin-guanine dinucleotide biosynthesis protein MobC [Rhizobium sp. Root564]MBX8800198.1 GNAT family N-acetyltransferase [Ochrobactrum sp. MR28]MBX8815810.1 GNAT family N-acetyltransferase [Ochrobactrum sp. MR31]MCA1865705.1 GNAT family N-acetyltransferase [Agrobacterium tomkonis]MCA1876057.1 GNAT family N-acetyltransferase [Agrobacterium tumefaciens]PZU79236.1 MAG: GNAT family N-acetyltransferase [Rhizobium
MINAGDSGASYTIRDGLRTEHRAIAAAGYWEAFSRKLRYPLGPENKALVFLERVFDADHAISAVSRDGAFLGVAGFKTPAGAFVGGGLEEMAKVYGWLGSVARGWLIGILERKCEPGTLLMDGIFVRPEARSLGVGSALLEAIERRAVANGLKQVRLDVIDENPRARVLYQSRGFEARSHVSMSALKPVFGFRSTTTMIKTVG